MSNMRHPLWKSKAVKRVVPHDDFFCFGLDQGENNFQCEFKSYEEYYIVDFKSHKKECTFTMSDSPDMSDCFYCHYEGLWPKEWDLPWTIYTLEDGIDRAIKRIAYV